MTFKESIELKQEAVWALTNVLPNFSKIQISMLVSKGLIEALSSVMVISRDTSTLISILDSINFIMHNVKPDDSQEIIKALD